MALQPSAMPSADEVRETLLDRWYFPYRKQIWAGLLVGAIAVVAILWAKQWQRNDRDNQWNRLAVATSQESSAQLAPLRRLIQEYPAAPVTPWAMQSLIAAQIELGAHDDALATLAELRAKFPDFVISTESMDSSATRSLAHQLEESIKSQAAWEKEHAYVHPVPSKAREVLVETTAGDFWLHLYSDLSPAHVEEFVRRAKSGVYNGTQVYATRVRESATAREPLLFEAGSSWSNVNGGDRFRRDPGDHDRDEPDAVQEPEQSRYRIRHQRGVVSSVMMGSGESMQRFQVILAKSGMSQENGRTTPFAAVADRDGSMDVVDRIGTAPTYGTTDATKDLAGVDRMRDHPYPPIYIRRVSVWASEKLEDGHTWDTKRVRTKDAEPWETTLPKPFGPEDLVSGQK
ncbi:MAG: hypothetical protein HMLKMBBP_01591 [Planctomycetes bacterium]|nr:hypothetical protein [Planctomycetota bacterium]